MGRRKDEFELGFCNLKYLLCAVSAGHYLSIWEAGELAVCLAWFKSLTFDFILGGASGRCGYLYFLIR